MHRGAAFRAGRRDILQGLRILVVEDELLVALGLEDMLTAHGCKVVGPIATLDGAIAAAATEELDGAILDVNLRGQPAYPVAERLRERGVPFIFCTGYAETDGVPADYQDLPRLEKPYDETVLKEAMLLAFTTLRGSSR